jgi:hypothetical protein
VDDGDRLARRGRRAVHAALSTAADGVVEHQHAGAPGDVGNETLRFRVVDPAQFVFVIEVLDRAALLDDGQTLDIQRQVRGSRHRFSSGE